MLTDTIKDAISTAVLCWLATCGKDGMPNVSPKEIFTSYQDDSIIIANIASPQTVKNIKFNGVAAVSFIDVLVQKGFQLKGPAYIITSAEETFADLAAPLLKMTEGKFPFASITRLKIEKVKTIIAPRYLFYPETTETEQIIAARKQYGLDGK